MSGPWEAIERALAQALELGREERAHFIRRLAEDDPSLAAEIESLAAAHESDPDFLRSPFRGPAPEEARWGGERAEPDALPDSIGLYRPIRRLGRGGMGEVYLALHEDAGFRRQVAVKVIRRGLDTEDFLRRFRLERQILASLRHPNIAHLLDAGATADGRPYYVMEYIDGEPITRYCQGQGLPIRERLELFRTVCDAVQHAHRNLVVHRDLKPRNILVTAQGIPKLVDFGVAKLLNPGLAHGSIPVTRTELRVLTPEYASPEQMTGQRVSTASDVYALGVVLFELLTDRRPYELGDRPPAEARRIVCEGTCPPPSAAAPDASRRKLRGDLDRIVLMAMRKEPARRYSTADRLSEDLDRYLRGHPVDARPDTITYRVGKFVRRHRAGVAMATVSTLLLIGATIVTLIQSARVRDQADLVGRERDRAEAVASFLVGLFEAAGPDETLGRDPPVSEVLERGFAAVDTAFAEQPPVRAEMLAVLARVYTSLGRYVRAEEAARTALATRRALDDRGGADVAESLKDLADIQVATGAYEDAERLYREALSIARRLFGPEDPRVVPDLVGLADVLQARGDLVGADSFLTRAVEIRRRHAGGVDGAGRLEVAESIEALAGIDRDRGDLDSAISRYREALGIQREALPEDHPTVGATVNNLATALFQRGDYEEAERMFREGLDIARRVYGEEHPNTATALDNVGAVLHARGEHAAAESVYVEALELRRRRLGDRHPDLLSSYNNLGGYHQDLGQLEEAERMFDRAVTLARSVLGIHHPSTATLTLNLANVVADRGDVRRAEALYRDALTVLREALPLGHPATAAALAGLGDVLTDLGSAGEAEPLLREAVDQQVSNFGEADWRTAHARVQLGKALASLGRYEEAEPLLVEGLEILRAERGERDRLTMHARDAVVGLYENWGRPSDAARYRARG